MNIDISIRCTGCEAPTNCRIGLSNRPIQPLRFGCSSCEQPIDIVVAVKQQPTGLHTFPMEFVGAERIADLPFDETTSFVDLHLDFPVTFEKYVPGHTPFLRAAQRIGFEAIGLHQARLQYLDQRHPDQHAFAVLLKHYVRGKVTPFRTNASRIFNVEMKSEKPQDVNAALYDLIAVMMWPFALPGENEDSVTGFLGTLRSLHVTSKTALESFVQAVIDTGFLKKLQVDCLSIYPRVLAAELSIRPALFLDLDDHYEATPIAMRVSTNEFSNNKDLYKDIAEIISRQFVLVAGINNLLHRGDHAQFRRGIGLTKSGKDLTPKDLDAFARVDFGQKAKFIDNSWYKMRDDAADNQLRNAIAHFKTEYDDGTQQISYYPRKDGLEASAPEKMFFLEFMRRVLVAYREMHRLHQLIKALFYYDCLVARPT